MIRYAGTRRIHLRAREPLENGMQRKAG
jgi:hypothetical protein